MDRYEEALSLWQRKQVKTGAELAEALNMHSISFAYHSGNLENDRITYNDTREIFDHDSVTSYTGDLRTLFEIRNAKDANELFLQSFDDGNGRTGRLTMNYFLVMNGHPPVTIHQEDRKDYYAALEAWDERQELAPMESFLREQTIKTWEKQIDRGEHAAGKGDPTT